MTHEQKENLVNSVLSDSKLPIKAALDYNLRQDGDFYRAFQSWPLSTQLRNIAQNKDTKHSEDVRYPWPDKVVTLCYRLAEIQNEIEKASAEELADEYLNLLSNTDSLGGTLASSIQDAIEEEHGPLFAR